MPFQSTLSNKIIFKFVPDRPCRGFCIASISGCLQWVESIPRYIFLPFCFSQMSIFINIIHKRGSRKTFNESGFLNNMLCKVSSVKTTSLTIFGLRINNCKVNSPSISKYAKKIFRNSQNSRNSRMSIDVNPFIRCYILLWIGLHH